MTNVNQAIKVAVSIRKYLQENTKVSTPSNKDFFETRERVFKQLQTVSRLKS